jgi:hypothetical protein
MLVGAAGDFPPQLREAFHKSGTGHLLATSGLHVMMALQMVYLLLRGTPIPFAGRIGLVIAAAWGYALLAGLRPSIVRAATMTTCALCAPLLGREADSLNALGFAGALWLVIAPARDFRGRLPVFVLRCAVHPTVFTAGWSTPCDGWRRGRASCPTRASRSRWWARQCATG